MAEPDERVRDDPQDDDVVGGADPEDEDFDDEDEDEDDEADADEEDEESLDVGEREIGHAETPTR